MRLLDNKVELIEQSSGLDGIYKQIEIAGRTCYKSEDKITDDSAKKFVDMIGTRHHLSVYEHGTVYLKVDYDMPLVDDQDLVALKDFYIKNPYSKIYDKRESSEFKGIFYITTNYRVIVENSRESDLKYLCDPTEYHEKRHTFRFTTQIVISRACNRHRTLSVSEQSTRYCNYTKDKFGNEISVSIPEFIDEHGLDSHERYNSRTGDDLFKLYCSEISQNEYGWMDVIDYWLFANLSSAFAYNKLISKGVKPEEARTILPLDTNTEVVYTAFDSDWDHFIELRTSEAAHPDVRSLTNQVKNIIENGKQ